MLTEICAEIKNYFTKKSDRHLGEFAIVNGQITPSFDIPTDYIRIIGSYHNDGVHKISDHDLIDEDAFHGAIWIMRLPKDFLDLVEEIEDWQKENGSPTSVAMGPFQSESFGGYSYSKAQSYASQGNSGSSASWKTAYASRLNIYRRLREL